MKLTTPQIVWHSKEPVFSADFHHSGELWRLATGGADKDIKVDYPVTPPTGVKFWPPPRGLYCVDMESGEGGGREGEDSVHVQSIQTLGICQRRQILTQWYHSLLSRDSHMTFTFVR